MAPERSRVSIIQIDHRLTDTRCKGLADIKSSPVRMHKVRRTSRAEYARRTRRTRSVQTDSCDIGKSNARLVGSVFESVCDLLKADFGSFFGPSRVLEQFLNKELLLPS